MIQFRSKCGTSTKPALPRKYAYRLMLESVNRRRSLAYGELHSGEKYCALGCFWKDHPDFILDNDIVDEIASINDLAPRATPKSRWNRMKKWLKMKVESL